MKTEIKTILIISGIAVTILAVRYYLKKKIVIKN